MQFEELGIDPETLAHREIIAETFARFNGGDNEDILKLSDPETAQNMTVGEIQRITMDSHDIVMRRIVAEGACPDCLQEEIIDCIDAMGVQAHPMLIAFCVTWFTVGLHIGNNRS